MGAYNEGASLLTEVNVVYSSLYSHYTKEASAPPQQHNLEKEVADGNLKRGFRIVFQQSLVVSYSDANAASPRFAVTDSISIGY
jgi:hypothetical protein